MRRRWIFLGPLAVLGIVAFIFIGGEVVMRLWNWLLPALFGFRQITFWQALGLLVLCRILFGGFHGHGAGPGSRARRRARERMEQRWEQMTPEEREKYRQRRGGYCGPVQVEPKG
jgi:hypothetical protein